ncbi:MAG: type II secretion system secretin GspD [Burkholderiaceae bacterium]|nr:type II secretion system secretin GspD [Burkholderiaceae bacterium]
MKQRVELAHVQPRRAAIRYFTVAVLSLALAGSPMAQQAPELRFRGEPVTLNFVNADIEGVTRAVGAILKQQFLVDPRVRGNITLYTEEPIPPREVYLNYLAALRGLGFTVVEVGGLLKVVPEADAKLQTGTVSVGESPRRGDQILTQIFRLNHENVNNLVAVLRPLISPNNTINASPSNNTLVITDYADNLQRIAKIIAAMDTPASGDVEVITLQHAVAADVAALVQKLTDSSPAPGGLPGATAQTILVDARSNALIVRATNPERMANVKAVVAKLDQPQQGGGPTGNIYVMYLKNADAVRLAEVLRGAFGGGSGTSTSGSVATASNVSAQAGANTAATAPVSASASPTSGGFIQADPATNSLIITAPEPLYRQVRAMIEKLDTRRAQVYIESMIVEVSGDNAADFGFQWQGLLGKDGDKNLLGIGTNFTPKSGAGNIISINKDATSADGNVSVGEGLNIGLVRNFNGVYALAAIARVLQNQSNTNIISTPNLITLDNEEAKIVVGSNVPFITGQFTNTGTGTTNPFQTIERKDVGITLRIKPQIGEGGTVRMTIFQESSSVQEAAVVGTSNAGPSTNKRSIESTVVVDDGQIIVLGGLIEDKFTLSKSKVPLLGDIPLLGALFRSESRVKNRTNLMVFLRPTVMRDTESVDKVSLDRYDAIRAQQQDSQPPKSFVLPVNKAPVLPAQPRREETPPAVGHPSSR